MQLRTSASAGTVVRRLAEVALRPEIWRVRGNRRVRSDVEDPVTASGRSSGKDGHELIKKIDDASVRQILLLSHADGQGSTNIFPQIRVLRLEVTRVWPVLYAGMVSAGAHDVDDEREWRPTLIFSMSDPSRVLPKVSKNSATVDILSRSTTLSSRRTCLTRLLPTVHAC